MTRRHCLGLLAAAPKPPAHPRPSQRDLCPVCGMVVARYPNWIATLEWTTGQTQFFDGARCLFRFLRALDKYAPQRKLTDMRAVTVTEFYDLRPIDARRTHFVIGSDVLGPMGHELVPLATIEDAREFLADHRAKRIVHWDDITPRLLDAIEAGRL